MADLHNSFRLLGYKIKELPDGCFITQNPNKKYNLFDSEGNIILSNIGQIGYVAEGVYTVIDDTLDIDGILYDRQGNQLDTAYSYNINKTDTFIKVFHREIPNTQYYNVYAIQGRAKFMGIEGQPLVVVTDKEESKLIYSDSKSMIHILDTHGNDLALNINRTEFVCANKYYIKYLSKEFKDEYIVDYEGKLIYKGGNIEIDNSIEPSSNLLTWNDSKIELISREGKVIYTLKDIPYITKYIYKAYQTLEPHIVRLHSINNRDCLLNMISGEKSKEYTHIKEGKEVGFIGDNLGEALVSDVVGKIVYIDKDTFAERIMLDRVMGLNYGNYTYAVSRRDETGKLIHEKYTTEFKKLEDDIT